MKINKATKKVAMNLKPEVEATELERKEKEKKKLLFISVALKKALRITPVEL